MTERRLIASGSPYERSIGFSRAVVVGERVIVSGTAPIWPDGSCDPDPGRQADRCFQIILAALREAGATPADVVRTRTFITDAADAEAIGRAHGRVFAASRPAATMVVVAALLDPHWKVGNRGRGSYRGLSRSNAFCRKWSDSRAAILNLPCVVQRVPRDPARDIGRRPAPLHTVAWISQSLEYRLPHRAEGCPIFPLRSLDAQTKRSSICRLRPNDMLDYLVPVSASATRTFAQL